MGTLFEGIFRVRLGPSALPQHRRAALGPMTLVVPVSAKAGRQKHAKTTKHQLGEHEFGFGAAVCSLPKLT